MKFLFSILFPVKFFGGIIFLEKTLNDSFINCIYHNVTVFFNKKVRMPVSSFTMKVKLKCVQAIIDYRHGIAKVLLCFFSDNWFQFLVLIS